MEAHATVVKGSRLKGFIENEHFEFNYQNFCERYDIEVMERAAKPTILAGVEQIIILHDLINLLHIPVETTNKWLTKYHVQTFEEMSESVLQSCIDYLRSKLPKEK